MSQHNERPVVEITIEQLMDDDNWAEVFGDKNSGNVSKDTEAVPPGSTVSTTPPNRSDVAKIIAAVNGVNDGPAWVGLFRLKDRRFLVAVGECDYTGWDCCAGNSLVVTKTLRDALLFALDNGQADRLGLAQARAEAERRLFEPDERAKLEAIRDNPPPPKPGQAHPMYTRIAAKYSPEFRGPNPAAASNELHTAIAASDVGVPLSADRPTTQDERRRGDGPMYAEDAMEAIDPEPFCEMTGPAGKIERRFGMAEQAVSAALAAIEAWAEARRAERDYTQTTFEKANAARANAERALDKAVRMLVTWRGGAA